MLFSGAKKLKHTYNRQHIVKTKKFTLQLLEILDKATPNKFLDSHPNCENLGLVGGLYFLFF